MKRAQRLLCIILLVAITALTFAACGSSKDTATTAAGTAVNSGNTPSEKKEEVITASIYLPALSDGYVYTGNEVVFKAIEEATGIKFKPIAVPLADYVTKLNTYLSSGDLPDITGLRDDQIPKKYGPQGAFLDLKQYMDKGEMPDFVSMIDKYPPALTLITAPDKKVYGAPRIYDMDFRMDETFLIRSDVFKKHNIPTTVKTFDDMYAVMKQLKVLYPDSTPYTSRWGFWNAMNAQVRYRDSGVNYFISQKTNKYEYGPAKPGYKDALKFMRDAYKDGLLDKDFLTLSDAQWEEKFVTDKAFITHDYPQAAEEIMARTTGKIPDGWEFVSMVQPEYNGERFGTYIIQGYFGYIKSISAKTKNADRLVKFINWTYSQQGVDTLLFGQEGDTYTKESDGNIKLAADVNYAGNTQGTRKNLGINDQGLYSVLNTMGRDIYEVSGEMMKKSMQIIKEANAYGKPEYGAQFANDADRKKYNDLMTPINTYVEECAVKVITGAMSLDKWDSEVLPQVKAMGVEEAGKLINDAYTATFGK